MYNASVRQDEVLEKKELPTFPAIISRRTDTKSLPPFRAVISRSSEYVAPSGIAYTSVGQYKCSETSRLTTRSWPHSAPASIPFERSNISTTDTPVLFRPSLIVCCRGAAPRYSGSKDGWTLRRLVGRKSSRIRLGKMCPNEAVMITCEAEEDPGSANGEGGCEGR